MPAKVDEWTQKDEEDSECNAKHNLKNIELNSKSTEWNMQKDWLQITEKRNPQIFIKDNKDELKEPVELKIQKSTDSATIGKKDLSKTPGVPKSKHLIETTQSMKIDNNLENENVNLNASSSESIKNKKPTDYLFTTQKVSQDGVSIASANFNSDALTAHFNSTWRKSIPSNESPTHEKESKIKVEGIYKYYQNWKISIVNQNKSKILSRENCDDPLSYLKQYQVILI